MEHLDWQPVINSLAAIMSSLAFLITAWTAYLNNRAIAKVQTTNEAQSEKLATIEKQTNGLMDKVREDSRDAGRLEEKIAAKAEAKKDVAHIAEVMAEKLSEPVAAKVVEQIKQG